MICYVGVAEGKGRPRRRGLDEHVDRIQSPLRSGQGHHTPERLDEHVDRIRSPLRSGQGHHTPERVGEAPTSGR